MKKPVVCTLCCLSLALALVTGVGVARAAPYGPAERGALILSHGDGAPPLPVDDTPGVGVDQKSPFLGEQPQCLPPERGVILTAGEEDVDENGFSENGVVGVDRNGLSEGGAVGVDGLAGPEEAASLAAGEILEEEVAGEEMERVMEEEPAQAGSKPWSMELSGDSLSKAIPLPTGDHCFRVWVKNSGTQNIIITFTSGSPTGPTLTTGIKTLAPGKSMSYYTAEHQPLYGSLYYANFTSGKADMAGVAACRVASTYAELDL